MTNCFPKMRVIFASVFALAFSSMQAFSFPLEILYRNTSSSTKELGASWLSACNKLTKVFESGLGGAGTKPFDSVTCQNMTEKAVIKKDIQYFFVLFDQGKINQRIVFNFVDFGKIFKQYETSALKISASLFEQIAKDPKSAQILVNLIMANAPFVAAIKGSNEDTINLEMLSPVYAAKRFTIFSLQRSNGYWRPKVLGVLSKKELTKNIKGVRIKYQVNSYRKRPRKPEVTYYLLPSKEDQAKYLETSSAHAEKAFENFLLTDILHNTLGILGSSQVGLRYGYPIFKDETIVSKATMFSLNLEIRDGFFQGLRWYWEIAPTATQLSPHDPSIEESITYSRAAFGWSLDLELPGFLQFIGERLDIIFKLGLLDVDGRFAIKKNFDVYDRAPFIIKNVVDIGGEIGIEHKENPIDIRLTGAANWAHSSLSLTNNNANFFSYRSSVDVYYHIGSVLGFDTRLSVFASSERLNLIQNVNAEEREFSTAIREVTFTLFFLGIGGSVIW